MSAKRNMINRVVGEVATKGDALEVVEWFSSTIEGQQHLGDMLDKDAYMIDNDTISDKTFSAVQSDKLFKNIDREIYKKSFRRASLKVAAVFIPLLIVSLLAIYFNNQTSIFEGVKYTELYIPNGENARIFFQDGSEVYLNSDTRIRYPERFGIRKREIFLDGEAYFNVSTNSKRPFIVNSQNTSVRVLGTSFNVNAYSDSEVIKVVLDKGKTSFHVNKYNYTMSPGQQLEYNKTTGRTIVYNLSNASNASLWKDNMLYFYDTPLAEVLKVLERKYDVKFHLQENKALEYSYTLTTKHTNLDSILTELQKIAPVRFDQNEQNIFVNLSKTKVLE